MLIHPADLSLYLRLVAVGERAAESLGLAERLQRIIPHPTPARCHAMGRWGDCDRRGVVRVVLRYQDARGAWLPGPLPEAEVWDTLAHELAHLRYHHHRASFWRYLDDSARAVRESRRV